MRVVWQYLKGRSRKHMFVKANLRSPACGATRALKYPPKWHDDEEVLKTLPPCGGCKRIRGI